MCYPAMKPLLPDATSLPRHSSYIIITRDSGYMFHYATIKNVIDIKPHNSTI